MGDVAKIRVLVIAQRGQNLGLMRQGHLQFGKLRPYRTLSGITRKSQPGLLKFRFLLSPIGAQRQQDVPAIEFAHDA